MLTLNSGTKGIL